MGLSTECKATELGPIPVDWSVSTVGKEFHVQLGKMLDAEKNVGTAKPFLGNRSVQWGRFDLSDVGEVRLTSADMNRYRLQEGDLLVCEGGEVGRSAIWEDQIQECYYQKALHRLRPKRGYNVRLMLNVMRYLTSRGYLLNYVTRTSIAHLPKDKFIVVPIPLPPTEEEQNAIAGTLTDADDLIESLEQLVVKKRDIRTGAKQTLLKGEKRLPGFRKPWARKPLGELLRVAHGKNQRAVEEVNGEFPILGTGGQIGTARSFLYDRPSVLIGRKGTIDKPQYMDSPFWTVDTLFYTRIQEPNSAKFLFYRLTLIPWLQYNEATGVPSLQAKTIEQIEIEVPDADEQLAIAELLSDMDTEISALERKLIKARQIKQGMMRELLTGRIRLK